VGRGSEIVTVFGSASPLPDSPAYNLAFELGAALARAQLTVCNGGYGGTMEAGARGAKSAGGATIGIITDFYPKKQANEWIDTVFRTADAPERLLSLVRTGNAFVVLPGGTGTLLELAAVWEFMNKGIIGPRPVVLLGGFWNRLVEGVRSHLLLEGRADASRLIQVAESCEECVAMITQTLRGGIHGSGT